MSLTSGKVKKTVILLSVILLVVGLGGRVFAVGMADLEEKQGRLEQIKREKEKVRQQIAEAEQEGRSLSNHIAYLDNLIYLTELEIEEAESKIVQTQAELEQTNQSIADLEAKLERIQESITSLRETFSLRVKKNYITSRLSWITLLVDAESFQAGLRNITYLSFLQREDKKLITQMKDTRQAYKQQKEQLEDLKAEKEMLREQLEREQKSLNQQKQRLDKQRQNKQYLLEVTQNKEEKYRQLLADLEAEQRRIQQAINELARKIANGQVSGKQVGKGEVIGLQGNTGYSTGSHLHFGAGRQENIWASFNPSRFIDTELPLKNAEITQGYGMTCFATSWTSPCGNNLTKSALSYPRRFNYYPYDGIIGAADGYPDIHNGVDMASYHGAPIRAVANGEVYYGQDSAGGCGAILFHGDSEVATIYWHIQAKPIECR